MYKNPIPLWSRASNSMTCCSTCLREVPKDNIELHKLRCSKPKVEPQHQSSKSGGKSKKKNQAKKEEEDIDALLESFTQTDKVELNIFDQERLGINGTNLFQVCRGEGCKVGVQTLRATCKFCRLRFCLKCSMPEVHGCGDAAKQAARQQVWPKYHSLCLIFAFLSFDRSLSCQVRKVMRLHLPWPHPNTTLPELQRNISVKDNLNFVSWPLWKKAKKMRYFYQYFIAISRCNIYVT